MKIAIDIDNTVFTNNSIIYKLLNNTQVLGNKDDTLLEYSKINPQTTPTKGIIKKIFPFINPSKFVAFKDSVDVINLLFEKGHEVVFLSNRPTLLKGATLELLDRFNVKYDALILGCKNKHLFCKEFGIDVIIDDQQKNCLNVAGVGVKAICLDHKPEEMFPEYPKVKDNFFHASNWKTVEHLLYYIDCFNKTTKGINVINNDLRERRISDLFKSAKPIYMEMILSKHFKNHLQKNDTPETHFSASSAESIKAKIAELQKSNAQLEKENLALKKENDELKRK